MNVRVRFAPSPTGYLHVGSARTALFNWLYAQQQGGQFVLRIEDTDLARSTKESVEGILEGMRFLGLDWDEGPEAGGEFGPYFQTERLSLYSEYAAKLEASGHAYPCYCTAEELQARRDKAREDKQNIHYDGRCRRLTAEQRQSMVQEGRSSVLRFTAKTSGTTTVEDRIRGRVTFDNTQIDDFVICKSDGMPTYNFAVVIDDALMQITHVIRGEDHLSNTPKQAQLYEALGFPVPVFAHIPLILGPDRARLSKRHGATSVTQYRDEGYLSEALVNYLALLGWSYDDSQTLFSRDELVEKFALEKISKNPAVFDIQKLEWMNGVYIREMTLEELYEQALPIWQKAQLLPAAPSDEQATAAKKALEQVQPRLKHITDIEAMTYYFFTDELRYNEKAVRKVFFKKQAEEILQYLLPRIEKLDCFDEDSLGSVFDEAQAAFDRKLGDIIQPVRVAVTGTNVSPGIYDVLLILGKERTCRRLQDALEIIEKAKKEEQLHED